MVACRRRGHGWRQIRRFLVLHKELDADDGELTRTQKLRRGHIVERYAALVEAFYSGADAARYHDRSHLRGRPQGTIAARSRSATCRPYPARAPKLERAA